MALAMNNLEQIRRDHLIQAAEGYLELGLPKQARDSLLSIGEDLEGDAAASFLLGEAFRGLDDFDTAIPHLERAVALAPDETAPYLSLGWCYKRTEQLGLAIQALELAVHRQPEDAVLHYNLACYWSLAERPRISLRHLAHAVDKDATFRELASGEPDFAILKTDPRFLELTDDSHEAEAP